MESIARSGRRPPKTSIPAGGECQTVYVDEITVARALRAMPSPATVEEIATLFGLLSDPTRIRTLVALAEEELCVCDLARVTKRSMPATSHQLRLLRQMKIVTYRMHGKLAYYTLTSPWVRQLLKDALNRLDTTGESR